jgi:hypothetical protein
VPSPSKDPRDLHPDRSTRRKPFLFADSGVPYTHHFFAGTCSVFAVLAITGSLLIALACGLVAQMLVDLMGHAERPK